MIRLGLLFKALCLVCSGVSFAAFADTATESKYQCYMDRLPEQARPSLFDVYPALFFSKGWVASAEMTDYFDRQKLLFKALDESTSGIREGKLATMASLGDIMRIPTQQQFIERRVVERLGEFDLLVANLETLITDDVPLPPQDMWLMNSDPSVLDSFQRNPGQNALSAVSLANNHIYDYGDDAIVDTLRHLENRGIAYSGVRETTDGKPYVILESNGIRVAYYSATAVMNERQALANTRLHFNPMLEGIDSIPFRERGNPCAIDYAHLESVIEQMKQDQVDFKVLSLHWGFEHEMYPRTAQLQISRVLMGLGFDVVFGAHTHTPQPAEICFLNGYAPQNLPAELQSTLEEGPVCRLQTPDGIPRKSIMFYSLGNFSSYSNIFWQQVGTVASLTLQKNGNRTDWHSPGYLFTYDHTLDAPNGLQHLTFLDEKGQQCPWDRCAKDVREMGDLPARHLLEPGPGTWEKLVLAMRSIVNSIATVIRWQNHKGSTS